LTPRDIWFFIDWTSTFPSPSHTVPQRQDSHLFFSNAWFIVVKSLLIFLQLPSCLTQHFISSVDSFLKTIFLWSSCFHRYPILTSSTWSILSWLRSSHKCWTKLIFNFLFICVSCLTWHGFFNIKLFTYWLYMLIA
jgi:hypothetical protein